MRALQVYMSALNGSCALTGFPCSSYEDFLAGQCTSCDGPFKNICPQIGKIRLLITEYVTVHNIFSYLSAVSVKSFDIDMVFII